jgi:glycyl-tRNA synthetase alpha chain
VGGVDLDPPSVELTYGLERIAMYIQGVESVFDVEWADGITYGEIHHRGEVEGSIYNFEVATLPLLFKLFDLYEQEAIKVLSADLVLPAYDFVLKCSHTFNLLEARGAISVSERTTYITRVRNLAKRCALSYIKQREKMGFPLKEKGKTV